VSTFRILRELVVLNATRSLGVRPYFQYRLFDPSLTADQKRRYLPDTPWANARLWSRLNPKRYGCLYANKLIFNRFFSALGLPVAKFSGSMIRRWATASMAGLSEVQRSSGTGCLAWRVTVSFSRRSRA
jgi:hypothetical protein